MTTTPQRRPYRMVARAEKRARTRDAIVAAMREAVLGTPYPEVRVSDVARAAGVSAQTVHDHFESKERLFLAAADELGTEILAGRARVPRGDVAAVVRTLVGEYERFGDANWSLLLLEQTSTEVAAALRAGRTAHRGWLEQQFDGALPTDPARRREAVAALYAATDVGTWKLLRRDLGLSRPRTCRAMEALLRGVLRPDGGG